MQKDTSRSPRFADSRISLACCFAIISVTLVGCTTSKVYRRPLSDVTRAIDRLQPQLVTDFSPECPNLRVFTNQVPGGNYGIWMGNPQTSFPSTTLSIQATNRGANETKVVVTRMAKGSSLGVTQRRDLERQTLRQLTEQLDHTP